MLPLNPSKAEIQKLKYKRFYYPFPIVQKRLTAVHLFATIDASLSTIGTISGMHRQTVVYWVNVYRKKDIEALYRVNYRTNQNQFDQHTENIIHLFQITPPMNAREAKVRIEKMTGISRSLTQVRNFLHRHGLHYIKMGHIPAKADTEKQRQWVKTS